MPAEVRARALTHASWAASPGDSYERYELLGDAVLDLALGAFLLERLPAAGEGEISRIKNQLRSARFCAVVARAEGLGDRMAATMAGTAHAHGARRLGLTRSVLADLAESALGAIYLERGWEEARVAAVDAFAPLYGFAVDPRVDPKTALQEVLQRQGRRVAYESVEETGPAHARRYRVVAIIDGHVLGEGEGGSRRAAEQHAARRALSALGEGGA
ncbi:MAG: ribonuclease III family protein [Gaiellales bacterium]